MQDEPFPAYVRAHQQGDVSERPAVEPEHEDGVVGVGYPVPDGAALPDAIDFSVPALGPRRLEPIGEGIREGCSAPAFRPPRAPPDVSST